MNTIKFTDTHTHPYYSEKETLSSEQFIFDAIDIGVTRMIMPNVDVDSIDPMRKLARQFPDNLRMAMGLHPTEVKEDADQKLNIIIKELNKHTDYIAVGEIGIDLYWDKTFRDYQMEIFDRQLSEAEKLKLPVIIHCREAFDQTLEVLSGHNNVKRVFHSFGGTINDVERILRQSEDAYFGINGVVTFKNSRLRDTVPAIPSERLLLETDSPYLAPVPHRGKRNQSAYLPLIGAEIARATGKTIEEIADITRTNSLDLFGF